MGQMEKSEEHFSRVFGKADIVYIVILAGDFDFGQTRIRDQLALLASDENTKPDASIILLDILELSREGKLRRVKDIPRQN